MSGSKKKSNPTIKKKLTKTVIDGAQPQKERYTIQDAEIPGFALRIYPTGKKSYVLDYREGSGRSARRRNVTVGNAIVLTPEQARTKARKLLAEIADGASPAELRDLERELPTLEQVINELYFEKYANFYKKESSVKTDKRLVKCHLTPKLGKKRIDMITEDDCRKMHREISIYSEASGKPAPGAANKALILLSKIMNLCEEWGLRDRGTNPCTYVKKNEGKTIERFLDPEKEIDPITQEEIGPGELERFLKACGECLNDDTVHPRLIFLYLTILATGARSGEIINLTIDELNLEKGEIIKEDHKGRRKNQKKPKTIELNSLASGFLRYTLQYLYTPENPWIFESHRRPGKPYNNVSKPWKRLLRKANITEFRIHDMRHTFTSLLFNEDIAPQLVQGLLGHKDLKTTQSYAHLFRKRKREANEVASNVIGQFFSLPKYDESNVVSINKKKTNA